MRGDPNTQGARERDAATAAATGATASGWPRTGVLVGAAGALGALGLLAACPLPSDPCNPGFTRSCSCGEGVTGTQTCDQNDAWSDCSCPGFDGGVRDGGLPDGGSPDGAQATWTVIRVIDPDPPDLVHEPPGADIDRISLESSVGNIKSDGCVDARLDPDPVPYPALDPADNLVASGTLAAHDATETEGFVSLGGAVLWCDTGVAIAKGDYIYVWEVHRTDTRPGMNDSFSVDLCQTMSGPCLPSYLANDVEITGPVDEPVWIQVLVDL